MDVVESAAGSQTSAGPLPGPPWDILLGGSALVLSLATLTEPNLARAAAVYLCWSAVIVLAASLARRPLSIGHVVVAAAFVFWYAVPGLVNLLGPGSRLDQLPEAIAREDLGQAVLCLASFQFACLLAYRLYCRHASDPQPEPSSAHPRLGVILLIGFVLGILPYFIWGQGISGTLSMVIESRAVEKAWLPTAQLGNEISAVTALTSSFLISSSMLLLAWSLCSTSTALPRVVVFCLGAAGSLLIYFDHGTRSVFALAVVPPACLALRRLAARSRATTLILGAIGAGAFVLLLQFQMLYRAAWTRDSARESMLTEALTMQGSTDYFSETVFAAHLVPREHEFFRESVVLQFLIGPVPRFLWPDKPVFDMIWFYSNRRANVDIYQSGGNVLPGIVGQQYMSWGPLGVALEGLLVGLVAALVNRRIESRPASSAGRSPEEAGDFMVLVWLAVSYRLLSPGFLYPVLLVFGQLSLSRHLSLEPRRAGD